MKNETMKKLNLDELLGVSGGIIFYDPEEDAYTCYFLDDVYYKKFRVTNVYYIEGFIVVGEARIENEADLDKYKENCEDLYEVSNEVLNREELHARAMAEERAEARVRARARIRRNSINGK